jgi:hypothetical protein
MIFRIITNNTFCRKENGEKIDLLTKHIKEDVVHFNWKKGVSFFSKPIEYKKIKKMSESDEGIIFQSPIYLLKSEGTEPVGLQVLDGSLNLLSIDDDGIICPKNIETLEEDNTIFNYIYESQSDWIVNDISQLSVIEQNKFTQNGFLSNYFFSLDSESGIIVNDYFIC